MEFGIKLEETAEFRLVLLKKSETLSHLPKIIAYYDLSTYANFQKASKIRRF